LETHSVVKAGDSLKAVMAANGGGYVAVIRKSLR
jgi:hypothetical protein